MPTGFFIRATPDVSISLKRFTDDTLTFESDIYPARNVDDSRKWDALSYTATATYRVRWHGSHAAMLARTGLREATEQRDTPTRRFGVADPPPKQGTVVTDKWGTTITY